MGFDNGPKLSFAEFEQLFEKIKSWSSYDAKDLERGALNFITKESVKAAAAEVQTGEVVRMSLPWNTIASVDNTKPALHYMSEQGDVELPEPTTNKDFIGVDFHGKAVSHFDAFTHIAYKNQLFGGKIEPGTAVRTADILAAEKKFGFTLRHGDAVLLRSGHFKRREDVGIWDPHNLSAGFHCEVMELFKERKISVIGADGDSDVRPSPVDGVGSPIHVLALPGLGIPLLDNLYLENIGDVCARNNRWTFLLTLAPLNIPRGTGSPLDPVAVL